MRIMKPGEMFGIFALCLLMKIEQMAASKCLKAFYGGSVKGSPPVDATLSSVYGIVNKYSNWSPYGPENLLDGDINTFGHTEEEENPYFMIEYASPTKINEVKVTARKNKYKRAKEMVVIVTDTKPTKGKLALGMQLGSNFKGPAKKRGQVITFKSEGGLTGKYVVVQQKYKGVMNLAEVQVNPEKRFVSMSSQYSKFAAEKCVDGNDASHCHTKDEENPYFLIEYPEPISVTDVKVTARRNCCWDRVKKLVVFVTNTKPTKGGLASGSQIGTTFEGPAEKRAQVITFKSANEVTGKYIIVQQQYKGVMNLAEVQVNRDHNMKIYLPKLKSVYTNCIEHPDCQGCAPIINHLPKLLQENIIKEGEIGVNNGSLTYKGSKEENYMIQWSTTLNLRKVGNIKTIKTVNEMVTINGTVNGIVGGKRNYKHMTKRPTGLYAGPGDLVTVTFPEALVGKIHIDIGHFQFTMSFAVETSTVKIGSPYGGLIIIVMKRKNSYKGEFTFSVTNAIKAPCFIYGKTTNQQWEEMRHYSPKWSVLRVLGQVEIFVQTLKIKDITDMNTTMARIKDTMDLLEESIGLPAGSRPGAEILFIDPARGGGLHWNICKPGVNLVGDTLYTEDKVNTDTGYDAFFKQDGTHALVLHEFGHGYCYRDFPDMGSQWTANTVSSYIRYKKGRFEKYYDEVHSERDKKDLDFWLLERMVGYSMYSRGKPCGEVNFNTKQFNTNDYERCWKWLNWIPQKAHGWKIWKDVNTLDAKSTKHYRRKTDRMVDLYCQATKHNMLPMFNFFNIQPSDESITNSCQKLPESELITKWINVAKCVRQCITVGDKDIRECGKMPRFPQHKGLCVISGVCNMDETNNGDTTTMNKKFDFYGSTGKRLNFAGLNFPKTSTSVKKETCFKRAQDFFQGCKNNYEVPMTATFYGKEQGKELKYNESSYTFPAPGNCYSDSPRLMPNHKGSSSTMVPKECNNICKEASYSYFGVQYYNECWCGNKAPPVGKKIDPESCDTMCKGDEKLRCGGGYKINIWKVCSEENCEFKYE